MHRPRNPTHHSRPVSDRRFNSASFDRRGSSYPHNRGKNPKRRDRLSVTSLITMTSLMMLGLWLKTDKENNPSRTPTYSRSLRVKSMASSDRVSSRDELMVSHQRESARAAQKPKRISQESVVPHVALDFSYILGDSKNQASKNRILTRSAVKAPTRQAEDSTRQLSRLSPRSFSVGKDIEIRKHGSSYLIDAHVPLSKIRPGTVSSRLIHITGELIIEGNQARRRIYLNPFTIDGMTPPSFIQQMIRQKEISHLLPTSDALNQFLESPTRGF